MNAKFDLVLTLMDSMTFHIFFKELQEPCFSGCGWEFRADAYLSSELSINERPLTLEKSRERRREMCDRHPLW